MPGESFFVNMYECFMENKNMIQTFCGCKSSKTTLDLIKVLLVFIKKWSLWMNSKIRQNIKSKKGK